jgi:hypothetical protein
MFGLYRTLCLLRFDLDRFHSLIILYIDQNFEASKKSTKTPKGRGGSRISS